MQRPCELCTAVDPTEPGGSLQRHVRADQSRIVAHGRYATAVPTIGAFVPGYLLIVPTRHTTSIGLLPRPERAAVQTFTEHVADRLADVYRGPVLAFEYGLNVPGERRIEHGHLHLLPSSAGAALRMYLRFTLALIEVPSMEHLPTRPGWSYISVWEPGRPVSVYPVANAASPRIRLREVLAQLDPRVHRPWDWQIDPCTDLIQATLDDLAHLGAPAAAPGAVR